MLRQETQTWQLLRAAGGAGVLPLHASGFDVLLQEPVSSPGDVGVLRREVADGGDLAVSVGYLRGCTAEELRDEGVAAVDDGQIQVEHRGRGRRKSRVNPHS